MIPNAPAKPFRAGMTVRVVEIGCEKLRSQEWTVLGMIAGSKETDLILPSGWWSVRHPETGQIREFQRDVLRRVSGDRIQVPKKGGAR